MAWKRLLWLPPLALNRRTTKAAKSMAEENTLAAAEHGGGGEHGGGEHGEGKGPAPASVNSGPPPIPIVGLDEIFVNVFAGENSHTFGVKLELELFEESGRTVIDGRQAGIKNAIIATAREQTYEDLTLALGKLYFRRRSLRINEFLNQPVIRSVTFLPSIFNEPVSRALHWTRRQLS